MVQCTLFEQTVDKKKYFQNDIPKDFIMLISRFFESTEKQWPLVYVRNYR